MKKINIIVSGMTCNHCEKTIEKSLMEIDGVKTVKASFITKLVTINYDEKKATEKDFKDKLKRIGYQYKGINNNNNNNNKASRTSFKDIFPIVAVIIILYFIVSMTMTFSLFNFLPQVRNSTPLIMLFLIGLLTSIHCVGMCGSINLAVSVGNDRKGSVVRPLLYNLGRIISYTLTGAIVGALGSVLSFDSNIQGTFILIVSIFMLMMGLSMLGWLPRSYYRLLPKLPSYFKQKNKIPFVAGLLNGLMPCGPLQTMQLYALSTGSIWIGALSMFIFSLGTVPLIFGFGLLFTSLKGKYNIIIQRISSVLIVLLSLVMINRAFVYLGIDFNRIKLPNQYQNYVIAEIKDGYQYVEIELTARGYTPIMVQKGIPVIFNIKVKHIEYYGCTNSIKIPRLSITKDLKSGDNIIEFTPIKSGDITYSCWMGMVYSNIKVVDDLNEINK